MQKIFPAPRNFFAVKVNSRGEDGNYKLTFQFLESFTVYYYPKKIRSSPPPPLYSTLEGILSLDQGLSTKTTPQPLRKQQDFSYLRKCWGGYSSYSLKMTLLIQFCTETLGPKWGSHTLALDFINLI